MRHVLIFLALCLGGPAAAWEFSPTPICTLTTETDEAAVAVTYDASLPEYAISITLSDGTWPDAPAFAMAFAGSLPITIRTDRHELSDGGRTLTVRDRGFGNVLNGIEFNVAAQALSGSREVVIPTGDAGPALDAFRACPSAALS